MLSQRALNNKFFIQCSVVLSRLRSPGLTWSLLYSSKEKYGQKGNTIINLGLFVFSLTRQKSSQIWEFGYFGVGGILELWDDFDRELETVEWENLVVNKGVCGLVGRMGGGRQTSAILTSFPNSRIDSRSRNCLHSWIPPPPYSPTTLSNDSWLGFGLGRVGLSLARIPKS